MTENEKQSRHQVVEQIKRFTVFFGWRAMDDAGRKEYRNWIERHTNDAAKVTALVDECVSCDDLPTLAEMRDIWVRLYPPDRMNPFCEHCCGSGYEIIERMGIEGAKVCRCRAKASAA
jgi:hypothetical protein